jgi:hypothetical protein
MRIFMAVKIYIVVLWVITPCHLVNGSESFEGTYCNHLQGYSDFQADDESSMSN